MTEEDLCSRCGKDNPSVNGMDKFEFYKAIRQLTDKVWLYTYGNYKVKE